MAYEFNADEVFEMACQIERNGAEFYRRMSNKIKDNSIRKMLLDFAAMEKAHENVFKSMKKNLSSKQQAQTVFDPEGEAAMYLKAMADLHVFDRGTDQDFNVSDALSEEAKKRKVLRAAVNLEWEAISFYSVLKEHVPENLGKRDIDNIIKEEMRHVRLLTDSLTLR